MSTNMDAKRVTEQAWYRPIRGRRSWEQEGIRLSALIKEHRLFLNPEFGLEDLALYAGLNTSYASKALNTGLGVSFKILINQMRVEHAKALITEDRESLLNIALSSGFGSKASFNRIFKNTEGVTPSAYRFACRARRYSA